MIEWDQIPYSHEEPFWLNSCDESLVIPPGDIHPIRAQDTVHAHSVDYLRIASKFRSNVFDPLKQLVNARENSLPFELAMKPHRPRLQKSEQASFYLGKWGGDLGCWIEFRSLNGAAPETIPKFVKQDLEQAIVEALHVCQNRGGNFRSFSVLVEDNQVVPKFVPDWIYLSDYFVGILVTSLTSFDFRARRMNASYDWLCQHESRLIMQRYGQDYVFRDLDESITNYFHSIFSHLNLQLVESIEVAFAVNITQREDLVRPMYLALREDKINELFRDTRVDTYRPFFMKGFACIQARGFPSNFRQSLGIANMVTCPRVQLYSTNKALLRPTNFEEPFKTAPFTSALLSKSRTREASLDALLRFEELNGKFETLRHQSSGLRIEYELKIDMHAIPSASKVAYNFSKLLCQLANHCDPLEVTDDEIILFGERFEDLVISVTSDKMFTFVSKLFGHLTSVIARVMRLAHASPFILPEWLEIVAIFERLLRVFLTGHPKYFSGAMIEIGLRNSVLHHSLPHISSDILDLDHLWVDWGYWEKEDGNYILSFGFNLNETEIQNHQKQIEAMSEVQQLENLPYRQSKYSLQDVDNRIGRISAKIVDLMINEFRAEITKEVNAIVGPNENHDGELPGAAQFVLSQPPVSFFRRNVSRQLLEVGQFELEKDSMDLLDFARAIFENDAVFGKCAFKAVLVRLLSIRWLLRAIPHENIGRHLVKQIVLGKIEWFVKPLARYNARKTIFVHYELTRSSSAPDAPPDARSENSFMSGESLPPLEEPISFEMFQNLRANISQSLDTLHKKLDKTREITGLTEARLFNHFNPNQDVVDFYMLLLCLLCVKNKVKRSAKKLTNYRHAATVWLHYVLRKVNFDGVFDEYLKHFGGDGEHAFQNYGAGKKFFESIKMLETVRSKIFNGDAIKRLTLEQILLVTHQTHADQLAFFHLAKVIDQGAE